MSILKFLGLSAEGDPRPAGDAETETVRRIVEQLDHLEPDRARFIASFAYILGRVANADTKISSEETRAMERIVTEQGHLPQEQAIVVVQMAKTQNLLFGGTENYLVTREFDRLASREEKISLLDCLFAVSAADDGVSTSESNVIRQIADELKLDHRDYADARSRFREHITVLRDPDGNAE
jgi:uncharacterized tellurite resistance protein B-like protein